MNTLHHRHWPGGVPFHLTLPATSLWFNLEVSAARYPDKPAMLFYDTIVDYREFLDTAERLAGYLQKSCGVRRGDRVALYMQNSPQFMIAYYAVLRADAMVVPVNAMLTTEEVRHLVSDSGARVMFAAQELASRVAGLRDDGTLTDIIAVTYADYLRAPTEYAVPDFARSPHETIAGMVPWADAVAAAQVPGPHLAGPEDLCVMPYTSGTTGAPKGCIHTHATVMATLVAQTVWYGGSSADTVTFCTLPLFHVTAMQASMNTPIYAGSTIVILPRWDRVTAARMIERHRISHWTNITTMLVDFLSNPDVARIDLSSLKRIGGGGAAMPEAVAQRLKDITGMDYVEGYGLSETIAPSHINPPDRPKKQCLGVPIFDVDSRVVNPETLEEGSSQNSENKAR